MNFCTLSFYINLIKFPNCTYYNHFLQDKWPLWLLQGLSDHGCSWRVSVRNQEKLKKAHTWSQRKLCLLHWILFNYVLSINFTYNFVDYKSWIVLFVIGQQKLVTSSAINSDVFSWSTVTRVATKAIPWARPIILAWGWRARIWKCVT